jgi:hypothetical protein
MSKVDEMIRENRQEYGIDLPEDEARELAELQLEDLKRKGCTLEHIGECHGCSAAKNGSECPLYDWEERHPEYANDELAMKIKALESKSRDQFKAKMKAKVTEEFKKLKVEVDLTEAARSLEIAAKDMIEAAREFEEVEGQSDEVQLKALAKVNEALDKIRHSKLGFFLEKTKWFA